MKCIPFIKDLNQIKNNYFRIQLHSACNDEIKFSQYDYKKYYNIILLYISNSSAFQKGLEKIF